MSAIQWGYDTPYQNCSKACSDLIKKYMARCSNERSHQQRVFKAGAALSRMNLCTLIFPVGNGGGDSPYQFSNKDFSDVVGE